MEEAMIEMNHYLMYDGEFQTESVFAGNVTYDFQKPCFYDWRYRQKLPHHLTFC